MLKKSDISNTTLWYFWRTFNILQYVSLDCWQWLFSNLPSEGRKNYHISIGCPPEIVKFWINPILFVIDGLIFNIPFSSYIGKSRDCTGPDMLVHNDTYIEQEKNWHSFRTRNTCSSSFPWIKLCYYADSYKKIVNHTLNQVCSELHCHGMNATGETYISSTVSNCQWATASMFWSMLL